MGLPLVAYSMIDTLSFTRTAGHFADRYNKVTVFEVSGGAQWLCRLRLHVPSQPGSRRLSEYLRLR